MMPSIADGLVDGVAGVAAWVALHLIVFHRTPLGQSGTASPSPLREKVGVQRRGPDRDDVDLALAALGSGAS
jgi:hypothetical protein